jgi:hypothetical protein
MRAGGRRLRVRAALTEMPTDRRIDRRDVLVAAGLTLALLAIHNSNGREIGSFDSQPHKFAVT